MKLLAKAWVLCMGLAFIFVFIDPIKSIALATIAFVIEYGQK